MSRTSPVAINDESLPLIACELGRVPHLSEKMLVDLVNGSETAQDLIRDEKNEGTFCRLFGALDGSNRRRDLIIKEQMQASIEALTSFAFDLTDSVRLTQENLKIVADKLRETRDDLLCVAKSGRLALEQLQGRLLELDMRVSVQLQAAEDRLDKIEDKIEIDQLIKAWESGRFYVGYPLPAQIAFVIDDLARGQRGCRIASNSGISGYLLDSIINVCRIKDSGAGEKTISLTRDLLPLLDQNDQVRQGVIAYGLRMPMSKHGYLHNTMADYAGSTFNADLVRQSQMKGNLPELMDLGDLTEILMDEAFMA